MFVFVIFFLSSIISLSSSSSSSEEEGIVVYKEFSKQQCIDQYLKPFSYGYILNECLDFGTGMDSQFNEISEGNIKYYNHECDPKSECSKNCLTNSFTLDYCYNIPEKEESYIYHHVDLKGWKNDFFRKWGENSTIMYTSIDTCKKTIMYSLQTDQKEVDCKKFGYYHRKIEKIKEEI